MPRLLYFVYEVNADLEDMLGTVLSVHASDAGAVSACAMAIAKFQCTHPHISAEEAQARFSISGPESLPTLFGGYDHFHEAARASEPPGVGGTVSVVTLSGDIGDGVQGAWATHAQAAAWLAKLSAARMNSADEAEGFEMRIDDFVVLE